MPRRRKASQNAGLIDMSRTSPAWEVIQTLASGGADPSRLLELYYWTREPGIVELIRAYLSMPAAAQRSLGDFLLNAKPRSIAAEVDSEGRLLLSQKAAVANAQPERLRRSTANR
jgi:hypothetical protein